MKGLSICAGGQSPTALRGRDPGLPQAKHMLGFWSRPPGPGLSVHRKSGEISAYPHQNKLIDLFHIKLTTYLGIKLKFTVAFS